MEIASIWKDVNQAAEKSVPSNDLAMAFYRDGDTSPLSVLQPYFRSNIVLRGSTHDQESITFNIIVRQPLPSHYKFGSKIVDERTRPGCWGISNAELKDLYRNKKMLSDSKSGVTILNTDVFFDRDSCRTKQEG